MNVDSLFVDLAEQEFGKHDKEPSKYIKQWTGKNSKTGTPYKCDIGYERFLAPEVLFLFRKAVFELSFTLLSNSCRHDNLLWK